MAANTKYGSAGAVVKYCVKCKSKIPAAEFATHYKNCTGKKPDKKGNFRPVTPKPPAPPEPPAPPVDDDEGDDISNLTKAQIIEQLEELEVDFNKADKVDNLRQLLTDTLEEDDEGDDE